MLIFLFGFGEEFLGDCVVYFVKKKISFGCVKFLRFGGLFVIVVKISLF